jgi:hypothetical protein
MTVSSLDVPVPLSGICACLNSRLLLNKWLVTTIP